MRDKAGIDQTAIPPYPKAGFFLVMDGMRGRSDEAGRIKRGMEAQRLWPPESKEGKTTVVQPALL